MFFKIGGFIANAFRKTIRKTKPSKKSRSRPRPLSIRSSSKNKYHGKRSRRMTSYYRT